MEQNLSIFKSTMVVACVQTSRLAIKEIGDVSNQGAGGGGGEGGNPHMKVMGMLFWKLKLNPKGDQCECGSSLNWLLH